MTGEKGPLELPCVAWVELVFCEVKLTAWESDGLWGRVRLLPDV